MPFGALQKVLERQRHRCGVWNHEPLRQGLAHPDTVRGRCNWTDNGVTTLESWDVRPCFCLIGSSTVDGMHPQDWSARILHDLNEILRHEGHRLVRRVDVRKGWGDIHYVTVFAGIPHHDAGPRLEKAIHAIVGNVLEERRHAVRIRWAEPG